MRKVLVVSLCLLFVLSSLALARKATKGSLADKRVRVETSGLIDLDYPLDQQGLQASAQADTYVLGYYTFDTVTGNPDDMGWTHHDRTGQDDTYWHIDDLSDLGGGYSGYMDNLRGDHSLWCGVRASSDPLYCGYAYAPGYGNLWNQDFISECFQVADTEEVYIDMLSVYDSEPGWDYTYIEYATDVSCSALEADPNWVELDALTGDADSGAVVATLHEVIPDGHEGSLKVRFHFVSDGNTSDADYYQSDGACIIDSLTITAEVGGEINFEDFESEDVGDKATQDGFWQAVPGTGFGDFADLYNGLSSEILQEDPCKTEISNLWAFIKGSTYDYSCGGHAEVMRIPPGVDLFMNDEIWSPPIDFTAGGTASGSSTELVFDVYRDLPVPNLIFYIWGVRSWVDDCPGPWRDRAHVYYGSNKDWIRAVQPVGDLIETGCDSVQVSLGVIDMYEYWYIVYGTGACHSQGPLIDNVEVYRIGTNGPQWSVRDLDLWNDGFPEGGVAAGTGRIDAANDVAPQDSPNHVYFGDSAVVTCSDPVDGLDTDPVEGGAAVYCYVSITPANQPGKMTPTELEDDHDRWPMVDSVVCDGKTWYKFRCDSSYYHNQPVANVYCIDINDHVITNGDTVEFFFGADGNVTSTYYSQGSGTVPTMAEACAAPMEIQILPAVGNGTGLNDILYVDQFSGRGGQNYFDTAFQLMGIDDNVDRFDKRGPSSVVGNGLANKCSSVINQLIPFYRKILWNSGDLSSGTVGDGTGDPDKSDDFTALNTFLWLHTNPNGAGIYFSGDDMAWEWSTQLSGASAAAFMAAYIPFTLVTGNHVTTFGISPRVIGTPGGSNIFVHGGVPDTMIAYGGCPIINDFDVISPTAPSTLEMTYNGVGTNASGAVIANSMLNADSHPIKVILEGFSYHFIRDDRPAGIPDRAHHLTDIIRWFNNTLDDPIGGDTPVKYTYALSQNYPNPFNPITRIHYSIKEQAQVTLKIYNVAGQLVKTLVNEQQNPRAEGYTVQWRGQNDAGMSVSSGVYFYKLVANNFTQTKKMVLLK